MDSGRRLGLSVVALYMLSACVTTGASAGSVVGALYASGLGGFALQKVATEADIVIRPAIADLPSADFQGRHRAVLEGEKATAAMLPELKAKLERMRKNGAVVDR